MPSSHLTGAVRGGGGRAAGFVLGEEFSETLRLFTVGLFRGQALAAAVLLKSIRVLLLRILPMVHYEDKRQTSVLR